MDSILKDLNEEVFLPNSKKAVVLKETELDLGFKHEITTDNIVEFNHGLKFLEVPEDVFQKVELPRFLTTVEILFNDYEEIVLDFNVEADLSTFIEPVVIVNVNEASIVFKEVYYKNRL